MRRLDGATFTRVKAHEGFQKSGLSWLFKDAWDLQVEKRKGVLDTLAPELPASF